MNTIPVYNVYINDKKISVSSNLTILQACIKLNILIPRFCYHNKLSVAGNCRMCLVEIENSPKPVVSCSFPVVNNMKIYTNTPLVKKARENILEFLLLNHPLDCPICDQGGECDLQDQTISYGSDKSRFYEFKRGVEDKNCGPLVKTIMTRCIHCTRCVRFINEMTSFKNLGTVNRGSKMEISTYFKRILNTEISGNIIDLCPVGALTSKPYAFQARSWELKSNDNIDIMDALASNIKVESKGLKILRILPKINKNINEEWISDKTRFFFDGLEYQRLLKPLNLDPTFNFKRVSWYKSYKIIKKILSPNFYLYFNSNKVGLLLGSLLDLETIAVIKKFSTVFNIKNILNLNTFLISNDFLKDFSFSKKLIDIKNNDVCLIIGSNPRLEGSIYNLKILKQVKNKNLKVYFIGSNLDLSYNKIHLSTNNSLLFKISEGKHYFCNILKKAKTPLIIYNNTLLTDKTFNKNLLRLAFENLLSNNINIHFLNSDISNISLLNLNMKPKKYSLFKFNIDNDKNIFKGFNALFLIGINMLPKGLEKKTFLIYQNTHGIFSSKKVNLFLPSKAVFEKTSCYQNVEGRIQKSNKIIDLLTNKSDLKVLNDLIYYLKFKVIDHKKILKVLKKTKKETFFDLPSSISFNKKFQVFLNLNNLIKVYTFINKYIRNYTIKNKLDNYYNTNTIAFYSKVLAKCSYFNKFILNFTYTTTIK